MTTSAYIHPAGTDIDTLSLWENTTTVLGSKLRPGMVLIDELGCPGAIVDHEIGSAGPRTGGTKYLVEDLDRGGWLTLSFHNNKQMQVAAR